jgi:hypothetical protein
MKLNPIHPTTSLLQKNKSIIPPQFIEFDFIFLLKKCKNKNQETFLKQIKLILKLLNST